MFWKRNKTKVLYEDEQSITIMSGGIISGIPKGERRQYVATSYMSLEKMEENKSKIRTNKKREKIKKKH